jgi:very-long-chain enoyl-CoA reductase
VKNSLAKLVGGMDPNRLGLFDSKNKILKDRKTLISQHQEVADAQEVFVKDLGKEDGFSSNFHIKQFSYAYIVQACRSHGSQSS